MRHLLIAIGLTATVLAPALVLQSPTHSVEVDAVVGGRVPSSDTYRVEVSTSFEPLDTAVVAVPPGASVPLHAALRQDVLVMARALESTGRSSLAARTGLALGSRPLAGILSGGSARPVELPAFDVRLAPRDR